MFLCTLAHTHPLPVQWGRGGGCTVSCGWKEFSQPGVQTSPAGPLSVSQASQAAGARSSLGVEPVLGSSRRPVRGLALGYARHQLLLLPDTACSEGCSRSSRQSVSPFEQESFTASLSPAQPHRTGVSTDDVFSPLPGSLVQGHTVMPAILYLPLLHPQHVLPVLPLPSTQ